MMYVEPGSVMEKLDMDEHQLLLTCLFMAMGTEKIYEITVQTVALLRENNREQVADMLEAAAKKMIV